MKKKPVCDLRKVCEYCAEEYGRKYRTNNRSSIPQLQPLSAFRETRTCSASCGRLLRAREEKQRQEKIAALESRRRHAIQQFVYTL